MTSPSDVVSRIAPAQTTAASAPDRPLSPRANAIRALAMDAVQAANSGHPGAPMGMAEMAEALWLQHLKYDPADPHWVDRDRVVLSNGHASMLLYAVLHLTGYDLPLQEIKRFRQWGSCTPGHPEVHLTPGVETTTGPLGQGFANAVGMALAEKRLAAEFNRPGHSIVDHHTFVLMGDGCMMEGISHEAAALAGVWRLGKLIALYDDNGISIDGAVRPWMAEDTTRRFGAKGWQVVGPIDGHSVDAVSAAIERAKAMGQHAERPVLIICRTTIGKGAPTRAGSAKAHGEPLGEAEIAATRAALGWSHPPFEIPAELRSAWDQRARGRAAHRDWDQQLAAYTKAHPTLAAEFKRRVAGDLPHSFADLAVQAVGGAHDKAEAVATRKASQQALTRFTQAMPELLGGSADLTGSNLTQTESTPPLRMDDGGQCNLGRHINYGVREFGMAAVMNGIALHGGFIPYGGTFLTFSDYSRNAIRMAALMRLRVIHVFTHDSIGLGEDGPTHQPIEHAASLRLIPGLDVWRPADSCETAVAWSVALAQAKRPSALLLSRQSLPYCPKRDADVITRGGYILAESADGATARAVIIATGSEVHLALEAQAELASQHGIAVRVVSMPSTNVFDRQPMAYRQQVLPPHVPRIAIEAGVTDGWWKYGCAAVIGIDRFGESAPAPEVFKHLYITSANLVTTVRTVLQ